MNHSNLTEGRNPYPSSHKPSPPPSPPSKKQDDIDILKARIKELEDLIDQPNIDDFVEAVRLEAAHQVNRWGDNHDDLKGPEDWFWLLGYLIGKALHAAKQNDDDKLKHHIITSAAALYNWHKRYDYE